MANRTIVKVEVQELTRYGFKDADGYVSWSKDISESDRAAVVPGARFDAEYYISEKGTRYLNKIVARTPKVDAPAVTGSEKPVETIKTKTFKPTYTKEKAVDNSMSKEEWAAKDQRISRQGVIQAAVQALATVVSLETLPAESVKLANAMLDFVNQR